MPKSAKHQLQPRFPTIDPQNTDSNTVPGGKIAVITHEVRRVSVSNGKQRASRKEHDSQDKNTRNVEQRQSTSKDSRKSTVR